MHVKKRGIIQSNIDRIFVDKIASLHQMPKSEKGDNSAKYLHNFVKVRSSTLWTQSVSQISQS